jgi:hypothetical protein
MRLPFPLVLRVVDMEDRWSKCYIVQIHIIRFIGSKQKAKTSLDNMLGLDDKYVPFP